MHDNDIFLLEGLSLEVEIPGGGEIGNYYSQLLNVEQDTIRISLPQKHNLYMTSLTPGTTLTVHFPLSDAIYIGKCDIIRCEKSPPSLILTKPYGVKRIQRRNFVRVDTNVPVTLLWKQKDDKILKIETETIDLSGGGFLVNIPYKIPFATLLDAKLYIPSGTARPDIVTVTCQVCRSTELKPDLYQIGVSFVYIIENDRDLIIKYLFKRMRELRKSRACTDV